MSAHTLTSLARHRLLALLLVVLPLLLAACSSEDSLQQFSPLPGNATVLVVGDSLVAGTGAHRQAAWPLELERRSGWEVINAGVPGDTTANALARLDDLLYEYEPDAVILAIGGNDFLHDVPEPQTRDNLDRMIRESLAVTPYVALVSIPAKSVSAALAGRLADHALYAQLASEHSLAIVPAAVSEVLSKPELRSDRVHANAQGYQFIAERVTEALGKHGWR